MNPITKKQPSLEAQSSFLDVSTVLLTQKEKQAIIDAGFDLDEDNEDFTTVNLPLTWCKQHLSDDVMADSDFDFDYEDFKEKLLDVLSPSGKYLMRIDTNGQKQFRVVRFKDIYTRFCEHEEWLVKSDYFTAVFKEYAGRGKEGTVTITRISDDQVNNVDDVRALNVFTDARVSALTA